MTLPAVDLHDRDVLSRMQIFKNADLDQVAATLGNSRYRNLAPGEVLLSPEQSNNHTYLLVEGRLLVRLAPASGPALTSVGPGECVGEMSILEGTKPSAYVIASSPATVLAIDHRTLWALVSTSDGVARNLLHMMSRRVRMANDMIAQGLPNARLNRPHTAAELLGDSEKEPFWPEKTFRRQLRRDALTEEPTCLVRIDVDRFADFNREHPAPAGTRILHRIAETLLEQVRPTDLVARLAEGEFVLMLSGLGLDASVRIADRLRTRFDGELESVTVSVGVALADCSEGLEPLLERTAAALGRARAAGGNCVKV